MIDLEENCIMCRDAAIAMATWGGKSFSKAALCQRHLAELGEKLKPMLSLGVMFLIIDPLVEIPKIISTEKCEECLELTGVFYAGLRDQRLCKKCYDMIYSLGAS